MKCWLNKHTRQKRCARGDLSVKIRYMNALIAFTLEVIVSITKSGMDTYVH